MRIFSFSGVPPSLNRTRITRLFGLIMITSIATFGAQAEPPLREVSLNEAGTGSLLFESETEGRYIIAPTVATDVAVEISGPIARTRVTQRFENTSDVWVEGIYVFPLGEDSAVDKLKVQIGERFIEGRIEERQKAREIYETAKSEGRKTALLEQERPNMFTTSVANIGPGETIVVQIEFQETLAPDQDVFSYRFPMVVAPRYSPEPQIVLASLDESTGYAMSDPVPDRTRINPPVRQPDDGPTNPVSFEISLDSGFPFGNLKSSYHPIDIEQTTPSQAVISLAEGVTSANRDFELSWTPASGPAPTAALYRETIEGTPYYLVMVTPPKTDAELTALPREITFVIDTSGSMGGPSIRQARQSLALAISRLQPTDTFNVIEFNSNFTTLFQTPQPVTDSNRRRALNWVGHLEANGGTEMLPALKTALHGAGADPTRLSQVIFLTDGSIGNESQLFRAIKDLRGDTRIFTVGIGSAPNTYFMSRAAEIGQGSFTYIGDLGEVSSKMEDLFIKLESPVITNLRTEWPDGVEVEAWPSPVPDIYKGEMLVIGARASDAKGMVWVTGMNGDQPWKVGLDLSKAAERDGISKLWARRKIASLEMNRIRERHNEIPIDESILETALTHGLVSRLTSLVAVDVTPTRPMDEELTSSEIPLNLPEGWDFSKVFGDDIHTPQFEQIDAGLLRKISEPAEDAAMAPDAKPRGATLPATASLSQLTLLSGLILLILSALTWLWQRFAVRPAEGDAA